ncbi:hypothetical protein [Thermaerobacter litoralis]
MFNPFGFFVAAATLLASRRAEAAEPSQPMAKPMVETWAARKPSRPGTIEAQADQIVADYLYRWKIGGLRGERRYL